MSWLERTPETDLFLSVLVLGEIRKGIAKLVDETKQAALFTWLEAELTPRFGERVLGVDAETALIWGRLSGDSERRGETTPRRRYAACSDRFTTQLDAGDPKRERFQALSCRGVRPVDCG